MELASGIILISALLFLLAGGIWIAIALFIASWIVLKFVLGVPAGLILASSIWGFMDNWTLTALPLFLLMGELLFRSNISQKIFEALAPLAGRLPGGLLHINVLGSGIFAAVSGSSTATTVTIGKMTLPELKKRGYPTGIAIGTLAASGTFGLLIPPSTMLIIYGFIAETSIAKLFAAGILPGIMLLSLFSFYVAVVSMIRGGQPDALPEELEMPLGQKLRGLAGILPLLLLITFIMVSMYAGWATATEAASLGVVGALAILALSKALTWRVIHDAMLAAARTTTMIMVVLVAAAYATSAMGFSQLPTNLAKWVASFDLSAGQLLLALTAIYIVLGLFLDGISMLVLTAATVLPMLQSAGIDLVWFGIYIVFVVEMSLITPPVGLNLFALQSITGKDSFYIARHAAPFFLIMVLGVVLIAAFPQIVMFLPSQM